MFSVRSAGASTSSSTAGLGPASAGCAWISSSSTSARCDGCRRGRRGDPVRLRCIRRADRAELGGTARHDQLRDRHQPRGRDSAQLHRRRRWRTISRSAGGGLWADGPNPPMPCRAAGLQCRQEGRSDGRCCRTRVVGTAAGRSAAKALRRKEILDPYEGEGLRASRRRPRLRGHHRRRRPTGGPRGGSGDRSADRRLRARVLSADGRVPLPAGRAGAALGEQVRMVFYDQRGHGQSGDAPIETYTVEQLGRDLEIILRVMVPRGPVVLVGHSMGGMTVLSHARQFPANYGRRIVGAAIISSAAQGVSRSPSGRSCRTRHWRPCGSPPAIRPDWCTAPAAPPGRCCGRSSTPHPSALTTSAAASRRSTRP